MLVLVAAIVTAGGGAAADAAAVDISSSPIVCLRVLCHFVCVLVVQRDQRLDTWVWWPGRGLDTLIKTHTHLYVWVRVNISSPLTPSLFPPLAATGRA